MFKNENVLIIGSGASAFDMVVAIDKVANKLTWVHKIQQTNGTPRSIKLSPTSTVKKYSIKKFTKTGAEFEDGSFEEFSIIVFATGYDFTFPFLSVDSGISVYDKCVQPLYKQCINANRPSLAIIGLPYFTLRIPLFEIQIKFCIEFWSGRRKFPNRNEMLKDIKKDFQNRNVDIEGNSHKVHYLGFQNHHLYYEDLARTAGIENVKPSLLKLSTHLVTHTFKNYHTFRDFKYKILNDFEFSCECFEKENN
ncbi:hypothetical protein PVAND_017078 [Polypedilum vanderplanki]|uniref:Flavin-containing monooxygenase n=1 Tax=Polypedilum vanderplanki TaxID=319348 RepID=A0A9J6BHQ0_POLVA|nr:hypothetical protein PVAND_017078 [Polypedilum vanderplanki]